MTHPRRILIPVEERELAIALAAQVRLLLTAPHVETTLLRVVRSDPATLIERGQDRIEAQADLASLCDLLRAQGIRATADWVDGADPAETIIERARASHAALIVMATHARQDLRRWVHGSVTERVLRQSATPLLLFNPSNRLSDFARILVALDGSPSADRILPLVLELARAYDSEVIALRVGPPAEAEEGVRVDVLEAALEASLEGLRRAGVRCWPVVVPARDIAGAILMVAEEQGVDVIAMTSHGETSWEAWPFGSTAEKVFRHSPLPLLVKRVARLEPPVRVVEPADEAPRATAERDPRVLIPLDGSELAARAVAALPYLFDGALEEVVLLRAHPTEALADADEDGFAGVAAQLAERAGLPARALTACGDPAEEILSAARSERPDLLVMSSHGRTGVARWLRGSVAERVLRSSPVPLLLLNALSLEDPGCGRFRRILVAHDGSERADAVLPWVERFARNHGADVVVLRVADGPEPGSKREEELARARLELSLGPVLERLSEAGVRARPQVEFGRAAHEILAAAGGADLVALTTHGRSVPASWWFGSVAERVLRHCRRPLLVVRAP